MEVLGELKLQGLSYEIESDNDERRRFISHRVLDETNTFSTLRGLNI